MRENSPEDVIKAISKSGKRVHLQAGDAESHSGIVQIREALTRHGGRDQGWTGRLDTLMQNPDQTIDGAKRYAFGVEGVSYRLRSAVGKGYLTDERLVTDTVTFMNSIAKGTKGRAAWHVISGLPTEGPRDVLEMFRIASDIDKRLTGGESRNLSFHWQPFSPIPGTPMQWYGAGSGARRAAATLAGLTSLKWCRVRHVLGRTDAIARICTSLSRSGASGVKLLEAYPGRISADRAAEISESPWGAIDPDAPLPWDFIEHSYPRSVLRRAYAVSARRFGTK